MSPNELSSLPMSQLESLLKKCFLQRPELEKRILRPEELTEYITWMIETFADDPDYRLTQDPTSRYAGSQMADLGRRILADPHDTKALSALTSGYENQQEDRYIISDHDISVGRMLRYMPTHWHKNSYFELYYAFSGECPVFFPNETITVRPGTVLIVAPSVTHASPCYHDDSVLMYYMLRTSTFDQVFWNQLPPNNLMSSFFRRALGSDHPNAYLHFETGNDQDIQELLYQLFHESDHIEPYRAQLMNSLMTTFFILLLRRYEGTARLPRSEDFYWKHEFSAVLSYIQTNYAAVKLPELSERFHYSERQITRIVQRCTGMSYAALINKLRMESAAALLKRNTLPIEAVSVQTGYSTVSSFYRSFSRYYHCTPAEYRSQFQEL